jgi:hypothetical protein
MATNDDELRPDSEPIATDESQEDEEEETRVRDQLPAAKPAFGGTMLGLGTSASEPPAAAPQKRESSSPPAAKSNQERKLSGTMLGLGDESKKGVERDEPKKDKKLSGTMLGLGDESKKAPTKAKPDEKENFASKTLVMDPGPPSNEKRPTPKKAKETKEAKEDGFGKTLPLPVDAPAKASAPTKSSSRAAEESAAPPPPTGTSSKPASSAAVWIGLAGVAALGAIWWFSKPATTTDVVSAQTAALEPTKPVNEPEPAADIAKPVVSPVEPEPAPPAPAPPAAAPKELEQPKAVAEVVKPAAVAAKPAPAPKPTAQPARVVQVKAESPPNDGSDSLSSTLAARVAVAKNSLPAARCRQKPDPSGTAEAFVTFAPSGQVSDVRVLDPYASTLTGACIEDRLKQVSMSAFSGDSVTVRVPIQLY